MLKEGIGDDIYHTHFRNLSDGRWWSPDPLEYLFPDVSPYLSMGANPIIFIDPRGDCPNCIDGKYSIQKGDTFYDLENKWKMEPGSLSKLNSNFDPTKLQIGQEIRTTLKKTDLPKGVELNSNFSLDGMDNFFIKGAKGVNKIKIIDEATFNAEVELKALEFKDKVENPTQSLRN